MTAPIQLRKPELVANVRKMAQQKGKSITDTLEELVERERDRLRRKKEADVEVRRARVDATVARFQALPIVGPLLTDDDLYDSDGLPLKGDR